MARNRARLEFEGFREMMENLDNLGGNLKEAAEKAMVESKKEITKDIITATSRENFPAGGKYSTGETAESIDRENSVEWEGMTGAVNVGYRFDIAGLTPILLMYGTPLMPKAKGMYDAIYSSKAQKKMREKQKEVIQEEIIRAVEHGR